MKRGVHLSRIGLSISLCFFILSAHANMIIYPMEVGIGLRAAAQIKVISKSDEVQFVKVLEKKILHPGTPQETEIVVDMNADNALVVTPMKMALSAGGERVVRLVSLVLPEKETTWRVYFEGVAQEAFDDASTTPKENSAKIGISLVWGVLVHVAPQQAFARLTYSPASGKIINEGTVRIPIQEIAACDSVDHCQWLKETATVYPDTAVTLSSIHFQPGNQYRVKYYDWIKNSSEEMAIVIKDI